MGKDMKRVMHKKKVGLKNYYDYHQIKKIK